MKQIGSFLMVLALLGALYAGDAAAISIGFTLQDPSFNVGDAFSVDIVVSGLSEANEIVSTFDLDVTYDATVLSATDIAYSTHLSDPLDPDWTTIQDAVLSDGLIDFAETSLLWDDELAAQQGDSVILATLYFDTIGIGVTDLVFAPDPLYGIDVKGYQAQKLTFESVGTASVTVAESPTQPVPEPATMFLLGIGLLVPGLIYRRKRRNHGNK